MTPNPLLKKLGFSNDARIAILHADDIGMCQASVSAFADLVEFGLISSGTTMVPCPWFPAAATLCRGNPRIDMGVHLTLNNEWSSYRWGPLSTRDPQSGLIDAEGYFPRETEPVQQSASVETVQAEMAAQVKRARAAGIDITHIDTHMGTLAHLKFIPAYLQLAMRERIPAMMLRLDEAGFKSAGLDAESAQAAASMIAALEAQGVPLLDGIHMMPLDRPENRGELARQALGSSGPGITHFIIHPAQDTPELRALAPDWPSRVADYRAFTAEGLRRWVHESGITVIGYRHIQRAMQG